ncbi:hypothetical protein KY321_03810, partial [Candidatus Woesearchaeota archaeon]|nr:hypothetical protein [Candidatus Woesearchaeota archaeon]
TNSVQSKKKNKKEKNREEFQIERYYNDIKNDCDNPVIPVYLKTGYITSNEGEDLKKIQNKIKSSKIVKFSQREINDILKNTKTSNKLLNDWFDYFKKIDVSGIDVEGQGKIKDSLSVEEKLNKNIKLKILDFLAESLKNKLGRDCDCYVADWRGKNAFCWIYPKGASSASNNDFFEFEIEFGERITLKLMKDAHGKKDKDLCNDFFKDCDCWVNKCKNKNILAEFKFKEKISVLDCSYADLLNEIIGGIDNIKELLKRL